MTARTVRQRLKAWKRAAFAWKRTAFRSRFLLALANAELDAFKAEHDKCLEDAMGAFDKALDQQLNRAEAAEKELADLQASVRPGCIELYFAREKLALWERAAFDGEKPLMAEIERLRSRLPDCRQIHVFGCDLGSGRFSACSLRDDGHVRHLTEDGRWWSVA